MALFKSEDGALATGLQGATLKRILTIEVSIYLDLSDDATEDPFDYEELDFEATSEFNDMLEAGMKAVPSVLRVNVVSRDHNKHLLDWEETS